MFLDILGYFKYFPDITIYNVRKKKKKNGTCETFILISRSYFNYYYPPHFHPLSADASVDLRYFPLNQWYPNAIIRFGDITDIYFILPCIKLLINCL